MKRIQLIAAALCIIMLTTVGAGVVTAQSEKVTPSYRVAQYDVAYNDKVVGKLILNTNALTYVLHAHGLDAGTKYYLLLLGTSGSIASATANADGDVYMRGSWDPQHAGITQGHPTFALALGPLFTSEQPQEIVFFAGWWTTVLTTTVHGFAFTSDGTPIANREVCVFWYHPMTHKQTLWKTTTKADGTFSITKAFGLSTANPEVYLSQDAWYGCCREIFFYNGHTYYCPYVFAKFQG